MRFSLKTVLIGTGVILGLQLLLAFLVKVYVEAAAQAPSAALVGGANINLLYLGISLGTFFIGGLIVGFMEDRLNFAEPIMTAIVGMAVSAILLYAIGAALYGKALPDNTLLVTSVQHGQWGSFFVIIAVALLATLGGGLIGERIRLPTAGDEMARTIVVIALALVLAGPFYLLIPYGLPLSIAIVATVILLLLVGWGYYKFVRGATFEQSIEEISISPERHRHP